MLTGIFRKHCEANHIVADAGREELARLMMGLFVNGIETADEIRLALDAARKVH